jgi:hypothetical protein
MHNLLVEPAKEKAELVLGFQYCFDVYMLLKTYL